MVLQELFHSQESFRCEVCGFHYSEEEMAEKCEGACEEGHCKNEITKQSMERNLDG